MYSRLGERHHASKQRGVRLIRRRKAGGCGHVHEVGVVEDGGQCFADVVEAESLFDEAALAFEGGVVEVDAAGVAEDFDRVGISVQGAGGGGDQVLIFGEALQRLFDDGLAGTRLPARNTKF